MYYLIVLVSIIRKLACLSLRSTRMKQYYSNLYKYYSVFEP